MNTLPEAATPQDEPAAYADVKPQLARALDDVIAEAEHAFEHVEAKRRPGDA